MNDPALLQPQLPITFSYEVIVTTEKHRHDYIELLYVLSGNMIAHVNDHAFKLRTDDLLLINPYDLHAYASDHCQVLKFRLHLSSFNLPQLKSSILYFDCNSTTEENQTHYNTLKQLLAQLVKIDSDTSQSGKILHFSLAYTLLYTLVYNFAVENPPATSQDNAAHLQRFKSILTYINDNYTSELQQKALAEKFFLTAPYFSRLFRDSVGIGFKAYINSIRLAHGLVDLNQFDWSIDFIADKNGFSNTRSFTTAFKCKYGLLPSEYRKQLQAMSIPIHSEVTTKSFATDQMHHSLLSPLAKYLEDDAIVHTHQLHTNKEPSIQLHEIASIATDQKGILLKHTFRTMTSIGKAKHILFAEHQAMLKTLQKEIGFKYIKFHGLLDDEMMVYTETASGEVSLNFTYIDKVIDFLLSIDLRPFIQFSFMPSDLSSARARTIFHLSSNISLPKDDNKWILLITQLILHLENRYSREETETWKFSLWNEPDSPSSMFGFDSPDDYFHFYAITYKAVKQCNPNLTFGCPSVLTTTIEDGKWMTRFIAFCRTNQCMPEFLNYHFYPIAQDNDLTANLQSASNLALRKSENAMYESIHTIKRNNKKFHWNIKTIFMSEWNFSISYRELLNDTAFKACYVAKNLLENYDQVDSFTYWSLSDFIEEVKTTNQLFHGGMGLFTYNGIKKPPYFALKFLSRLGSNLLAKGNGYFITKKERSIQILLYNYKHISTLYASGELFDMTFFQRYKPFPDQSKKKFIIPLTHLENKDYLITDHILNQYHGSVFDTWIEAGALPLDNIDEYSYLNSASVPMYKKQKHHCMDATLTISRELEPHEVRLIEINPVIV